MPTSNMSKIVDLNGVSTIRDWVRDNFLTMNEAEQMMASKIHVTFTSDFIGETYTITGGNNETYSDVVDDTLDVTLSIHTQNTNYTISCDNISGDSYMRIVAIGSAYGEYLVAFGSFRAYLICTSDPHALITARCGSNLSTGEADATGTCILNIGTPGRYSVVSAINGETTEPVSVSVPVTGRSYACDLPSLIVDLVPFATGSDAEIAAMIDAARDGYIDLQENGGWAVGDTRHIQIAAFTDGIGVTHATQSLDIVITAFGDYNNSGAIMQFDFKNALSTGGRINSSNTNSGGYSSSEMYTTTLPALVNALPVWLNDRLIEFSVLTSAGNRSTSIVNVPGNKLALRSEAEVTGTTTQSYAGEGSQLSYYTTASNRIKTRGYTGESSYWWGRSPYKSSTGSFVSISSTGDSESGYSSNLRGIAPFGCV